MICTEQCAHSFSVNKWARKEGRKCPCFLFLGKQMDIDQKKDALCSTVDIRMVHK